MARSIARAFNEHCEQGVVLVHPLPYYSQCVTYIQQMCRYQCCCDTYCILRKWYSCCVSLKSKNIEAFQSVHHVSFILCYMIFFVSAAASVGTEQMSTGHLVPIFSLIRVRKNLWEDITQGKV